MIVTTPIAFLKRQIMSNIMTNNLTQLEKKIRSCEKKIDQNLVQCLIGDAKRRINRVRRFGVVQYFYCFFLKS